jgi:acyl dehydratase
MLRSAYFDDLKLGDRFKTPGVTMKAMDTIRVVAEVVELKPLASEPDRGMLKFNIVTNQADEVVTTFIITQFMKRNVQSAQV